jgi:hypothetical protein
MRGRPREVLDRRERAHSDDDAVPGKSGPDQG